MFRSDLLLLALLACGQGASTSTTSAPASAGAKTQPAPDAQPPLEVQQAYQRFRGTLGLSDTPTFTPCAGESPPLIGLEDAASNVVKAVGKGNVSAYVEFAASKEGESFRIEHVEVAEAESHGCKLATGFGLRAFGNEPGWVAEVTDDVLVLTLQEGEGGRAETSHERTASGETWTGTLSGAPLVLHIENTRCKSSMAANVYPKSATLTMGDTTLSGCARVAPPVP